MRDQLRDILDVRTQRPQAIAEAAARRGRRAGLLGDDGQLFIIAADHPARGALRVAERPMAMADRAGLLERMSVALGRPGVDGVLAALPALLLGGEVTADTGAVFERWRKALRMPSVRGLVAGRTLLFPPDGDVAAAVDAAVSLVRG